MEIVDGDRVQDREVVSERGRASKTKLRLWEIQQQMLLLYFHKTTNDLRI